jgi:chemotaxis protein CheX
MELLNEEIVGIATSVWRSVLDLDIKSYPTAAVKPLPHGVAFIGSVQIRGAWEGSVLVSASGDLVRKAAAIMFGRDESAIASEEMCDALAELTNMVGGNLKALLPAPCKLSLPTVVEGIEPRVSITGNEIVRHVDFTSGGEPFAVSLLKRTRA